MSRTTLALDELLTNLTAQQVREMRAHAPVAVLDQADAAADDARRITRTAIRAVSPDHLDEQYLPPAAVAGWLRLGAVDALRAFLEGTARTCLHNPSPTRFEPIFAAAWKPGLVVCQQCTVLFKAHGEADRRCDGCGHVCAGPDHGDGIRATNLCVGALTYTAGVCVDCYASKQEDAR